MCISRGVTGRFGPTEWNLTELCEYEASTSVLLLWAGILLEDNGKSSRVTSAVPTTLM